MQIFDTAGRQEIDEALIDELKGAERIFAAAGNFACCRCGDRPASSQRCNAFDAALSITGIILTKLDGDARGGAALSMREVTQRPIKFAGTGEKLDQFELFVPERLAGRILGMGDVVSLVEKAAEAVEVEEAATA